MMPGQGCQGDRSTARIVLRTFRNLLDDGTTDVKARLVGIYAVLAALNVSAWVWAIAVFHGQPAQLGMALLAYGLGLRHAVDADHIAAIDNVTRKLLGENKRPVAVGFFFAMGHSAVVFVVAAVVAVAATMLGTVQVMGETGGAISTLVSVLFLFAIAAMNLVVFASVWQSYRRVRAGGCYVAEDLDLLLNNRGFLTRIFRSLFRLVTKSWHMFPLGFLFGLGFDTATEVALFGFSAASAAEGMPLHAILVFPLLFAAGMSLIDTTDGVLMLRAYDWALVEPLRRLRYNLAITLVSAVVAIAIGVMQALGFAAATFDLSGGLFKAAEVFNDRAAEFGLAIVAVFAAAWALSYLMHRFGRRPVVDPVSERAS